MMALPDLALAACLSVQPASEHVVAGDLASASASFASLPPDTVLAWAPEPGVPRVFPVAELRRLAARLGAAPDADRDLCVERRVAPLDRARIQAALDARLPAAYLEIVDFSRLPVPEGPLEFPPAGLRRGSGAAYWSGYVRYAGNRRFAVWARVRMRGPVVVAVADLSPNRPIDATQLRVEIREGFPQAGFVESVSEAAGKQPRHSIRADTPIPALELAEPPVVARGDTVKVQVWSGAAYVSLEARAEGAAAAGQLVALRNPDSKQRFFARVTAPGRASILREHP